MALQTVHLTNAWHNSSGGVATFYRALLAAAHAQWRIDLIVPGETSRTERISEFATIHSVEARRAPLSSEYRVLYPSSYLTHSSPIQQILRNVQPDVIETTDKYTLAYIAGLVRIGWIDGLRHRPALIGISCERMDDNLAAYTHLGSASSFFAQAYMRHIYFPPVRPSHCSVEADCAGVANRIRRAQAYSRHLDSGHGRRHNHIPGHSPLP